MAQQTSLRGRLLLGVASIGPLGYLPASGTVTVAVVGVPMFYFLHAWPSAAYLAFTLAFTAAAIVLHDWGDRLMGTKDSRLLVWDEIAGFLVAVAFAQYVVDSYWGHRGRALRTSALGRSNGILYFAPLGGDVLVRLGLHALGPAVTVLAWALVASTVISMGERLWALMRTWRTARGSPAGETEDRRPR